MPSPKPGSHYGKHPQQVKPAIRRPKLTPAQLHVIHVLQMHPKAYIWEEIVPVQPLFRTLGDTIRAKLRYFIAADGMSKPIPYSTFQRLFKINAIGNPQKTASGKIIFHLNRCIWDKHVA